MIVILDDLVILDLVILIVDQIPVPYGSIIMLHMYHQLKKPNKSHTKEPTFRKMEV